MVDYRRKVTCVICLYGLNAVEPKKQSSCQPTSCSAPLSGLTSEAKTSSI